MSHNPVKLSLNLPALERLLGGDTQLEIDLRHQVVNNFVKHHLTELIKNAAFKAVVDEIRTQAFTIIQEQIGRSAQRGCSFLGHELTDKVRHIITEHINQVVKDKLDYVSREMVEKIEEWRVKWEDYIERRVKVALNDNIRQRIDEGVKEKLAKISEQIKP